MKINLEEITNNFASFGKLNCTLYIPEGQLYFQSLYSDIVDLFKPGKISCSLLNLDNLEVNPFDISFPFQDDNSIRKAILTRGDEQIILEYYCGKIVIEHLTIPETSSLEGIKVLKKYSTNLEKIIIVCGFELSIDIDNFKDSLNLAKKDISFHPLTVIIADKKRRFSVKEYAAITGEIITKKFELIKNYTALLDLP